MSSLQFQPPERTDSIEPVNENLNLLSDFEKKKTFHCYSCFGCFNNIDSDIIVGVVLIYASECPPMCIQN